LIQILILQKDSELIQILILKKIPNAEQHFPEVRIGSSTNYCVFEKERIPSELPGSDGDVGSSESAHVPAWQEAAFQV
jgi:hypothetical protein